MSKPGSKALGHGKQEFRFRKTMQVGSADAENDRRGLREAFIDTGDLDILADTEDQRCVVVGRTGVGKTALLLTLAERQERTLRLRPESLSMRYVANSTLIPYLTKIGVHLDPFYQLLWRLAFITEIIRHHYKLNDPASQRRWYSGLTANFKKSAEKKTRTLQYFEQWIPDFWQSSDVRVREISDRLTQGIKASLGDERIASLKATEAIESTIREEIVERAQAVINNVSLERINDGMDLLREEVLTDEQKKYFIVIDDLDKDWVEIEYAYQLIDALLDAAAEFAGLPNVKVVVALRENIIEALHAERNKQSQQREKHRNLFHRIAWTSQDLTRLMDERIRQLVATPYGGPVSTITLLPSARKKDGKAAPEWLLERTLLRPRDCIDFVNVTLKIAAAENRTRIAWATIETAEEQYSASMLDNIEDEWRANYLGLRLVLDTLRGLRDGLEIGDLVDSRLDSVFADGRRLSEQGSKDASSLPWLAWQMLDQGAEPRQIWMMLLKILYQVSAVGVRLGKNEPVIFSYDHPEVVHQPISWDSRWYIHPSLYRSLRIAEPAHA